MKTYPSDLTKAEYRILQKHFPRQRQHHKRKWTLLVILNAIFYVQRTGCQWRYLPDSFPPWKTVYHYWRAWKLEARWKELNTHLREELRLRAGRNPQPSAASFDTQSVRTTPTGGVRGFDGYKRVNGRKRFAGLAARGSGATCEHVGGHGGDDGTRGVTKDFSACDSRVGGSGVSGLGVCGLGEGCAGLDARVDEWGVQAGKGGFQGGSEAVGGGAFVCVGDEVQAVRARV